MPKPDLEVPTPPNAIGYGCVIVKDLDEYQGFFIVDDESLWRQANTVMAMAMACGGHPIGAIQAIIADGVLNRAWSQVAIAALALSSLSKHKFFVIHAAKEPMGFRTSMEPLKATTVEAARDEINSMPEVMDLKFRLLDALEGPRQ